MARPTKEERHLQAADKLYEACRMAKMRLELLMEKRSKADKERKNDAVVIKLLDEAIYLYEGPEG